MGEYSNNASRAEALLRATLAMLRALGPSEVILVLPVPMEQSNSDLGLATPLVEQLSLSPAIVRKIGSATATGTRVEVLLPASTVNAQAASRNFDPPAALFDAALGILEGGKLLRIDGVGWDSFADEPFLYRIMLTD